MISMIKTITMTMAAEEKKHNIIIIFFKFCQQLIKTN